MKKYSAISVLVIILILMIYLVLLQSRKENVIELWKQKLVLMIKRILNI